MELDDQYAGSGMADLRQYLNGGTHFPAMTTQQGDFFSGHRNLMQAQHGPYAATVMMGHHLVNADHHHMVPGGGGRLLPQEFRCDSTTAASVAAASSTSLNGLEMEGGGGVLGGGGGLGGGDGGTGRWPRQETLSLLEIRSRLDSKFKEANQKGPLWDEVARKLSEEHGYQRSGKKCREKFENLYKYYKKTKDGKNGRQDGKHYRFFRQLEALYGDTSTTQPVSVSETHHMGTNLPLLTSRNTNEENKECFQADPKLCDSHSLSNSESDISSSDYNDSAKKKKEEGRGRRSWKAKIRDFIDLQMRKLMEKQDEWLEKMMKTLERKEQERMMKEEEWRKQESDRIEREHKLWGNERAWIEARDAALIEALQTLTGKEAKASSPDVLTGGELQGLSENQNENGSETINTTTITWKSDQSWPEGEITKLIQLRPGMESSFQNGYSEEVLGWY